MRIFQVRVLDQTRILLGLAAMLFVVLGGATLSNDNFGTTVLLLTIAHILLVYYIAIGDLTVYYFDGDRLEFEWGRKWLFNYKEIDPVQLSSIKTIVIDEGSMLKKIKTADRTIKINTNKIWRYDAPDLIHRLQEIAASRDIRLINSWVEMRDQGYLVIINKFLMVLFAILLPCIVFYIYRFGFTPQLLSIGIVPIINYFVYRSQMKRGLAE